MAFAFVLAAVAFSGCGNSARCDLPAFYATQSAHAGGTEVTICGTVAAVRRVRRSRSGAHRIFSVDTRPGDRVEVDANLAVMGDVPLHQGESVIVRGEYYYDAPGRDGIHWTHRTLRGTHLPGYIVIDGATYQ